MILSVYVPEAESVGFAFTISAVSVSACCLPGG